MLKTEKPIAMKDGTTLPAGAEVLEFLRESPSRCKVQGKDKVYQVRVVNAFNRPSLDELQDAVSDGTCESVGGETVEPDGWDAEGTPSWLLVLGWI